MTLYHILDSLTLKCPFEAEAVRSALNDMMDAHPVLRTSFDLGTFSEPLQLVHKNIAAPFQHLDLRDAPEAVRNTILKEFLEYQKVEYFDLTKVPLARFYIHALTNETLQFTFTHHHAILDGWSVNTLFVDIINRYFEYLSGSEKAMTAQPCPAMQHLVTLERAALKSEETFRYWRDIIGKTTSPQAKLAKASLANTTAAPAKDVVSHDLRLPSDLSKNLHEVAATLRVPVKSVVLAAHLKVLRVLFGESDLTTGLVCGIRPEQPGADRALGLFLNTLPLRQQLTGGTWRGLITATFNAERELLKYRFYPLATLQRERGGEPLFDVVFNYLHYHIVNEVRASANVELLASHNNAAAIFGLAVTFWQDPNSSEFLVSIVADQNTHGRYFPHNIADRFVLTLQAMVANVDERYEVAPLVSAAERRKMLVEWNATAADYPQDRLLHELFEEQAGRAPDAVAAVFEDAHLSYAELNAKANQLAHHLRERGVGPDAIVGICVERSLEMLVGIFGVLKAGGAYLPLDPTYPAGRLTYMIEDARPILILTQEALRQRLPEAIETLCLDKDWPSIGGASQANPVPRATPGNLAYVIYTSGSTGRPKGVAVSHGGIPNLAVAQQAGFGVGAASRVLQFSAWTFDARGFGDRDGGVVRRMPCFAMPGRAIRGRIDPTLDQGADYPCDFAPGCIVDAGPFARTRTSMPCRGRRGLSHGIGECLGCRSPDDQCLRAD